MEKYKDYRTGKWKTASVTFDQDSRRNRKAAVEILREKINATTAAPVDDVTFLELINRYREYQKHAVKPQTYERNYHAANTLMKILGPDTLISRMDAAYIKRCMIATGKANSTINEHLTRLKAIIRWGYQNDLVDDQAFLDKLKPLKDTPKRDKVADKFLEHEELEALLERATNERWRLMIEFMVLSGCRFGEAAAIKILDIDKKSRYIMINDNFESVTKLTGTPKTASSVREVYLYDQLYKLVFRRILPFTIDMGIVYGYKPELMLCDRHGSNLTVYAFNKYLAAINPTDKHVTSHIFRHTYTAYMAEAGIPLQDIAESLGHANSAITKDVYYHVTKELKAQKERRIKGLSLFDIA